LGSISFAVELKNRDLPATGFPYKYAAGGIHGN
jgi:hypothetical protein